jgi:hypothetical protein
VVEGSDNESDAAQGWRPKARYPVHGYAITVARPHIHRRHGRPVIRGDKPATLNSVELVGAKGMEILGHKLVGPEHKVNGKVTRLLTQ